MNRKQLIPIILAIFCQIVLGAPGLGGGRGLFRIQDAQTEGNNILSVSSRFMFRRAEFGAYRTYQGPLLGPEFSYSPSKHFEIFGSLAGSFNYQIKPERDYRYDWQGERFGAKFSFLNLTMAKFGALGFYNISRANKIYSDSALIPGPGYRALVTFDLSDVFLSLPTLTLNAGETFGDDQVIFLGAGLEMATKMFRVFFEASTEQKWNSPIFSQSAEIRLTPGIRARLPFGLGFEAGIELGLTSATPDYVAILGLNYTGSLVPSRPQSLGIITGRVVDIGTGEPVAANIKLLNNRYGTITTDPKTGVFTIKNVPVGVTIIEATNGLYHTQAMPLTIKEDEVAMVNFDMQKLLATGTIAGVVTDASSEQPLQASISLQGDKMLDVETDPLTGFFQLEDIPVGIHTIYTKKDGYSSAIAVIEVKDSESTIRNFKLVMQGTRIVLRDINFDFDKATIKPESNRLLDEAARILKENPNIMVEIRGYTDTSGTFEYNAKLSQKRAQAVVNYFIYNYGIEPNRLVAKGFGELNPIAPNNTREGRLQNRRVEFIVMGDGAK